MATLEKIRSKSVLLIIVIGVALLAFIVGDAITNSRNLFGEPSVIAKVDGEKIDYTEFQRRYEEASKQNQESQRPMDEQELAESVLQQLILEKILNKAIDELGIEVNGEQLRQAMFQGQSQEVMVIAQQLQTLGANPQSIEEVYDMVFNPKKYGLTDKQVADMQRLWVSAEQDMKQQLAVQTYANLLQGAIQANDLDKRALYDQENISSDTRIAFKPYGDIDAKKYPVSDAELKAKYEEQKNRYRIDEPSKSVNMIAVQVNPSEADIKENAQLAAKTAQTLRSQGAGALDKLKAEGIISQHYVQRLKDLNGLVKAFVTSAPADSVAVLKQNQTGFTIVRNGKNLTEVDSLQLNIVQVAGAKLPAMVLAKLNGGVGLDSITSIFKDSVQVQKEQWLELVNRNGRIQMDKAKVDTLLAAGAGYFILDQAPQGAVLAQVVKKNAPVQVYEFDQVDYMLTPSTKTVEDARAKLENYIAKNNDPVKFGENAAKAGYTSMPLIINPSTPALNNGFSLLPNSRPVVAWTILDGGKGEISEVFENGDTNTPWLYAVGIVDEFEDFIPYTDAAVKKELEQQIRGSKYGDDLVKQYQAKGNTVDQVAQAMGVTPADREVRMSDPGSVGDAVVTGMIVMTPAGKPVVVAKGNNGVYAYQVKAVKNNKLTYEDSKYMQQYMRKHQPNFQRMLRNGKKIENRLLKFYGGNNR